MKDLLQTKIMGQLPKAVSYDGARIILDDGRAILNGDGSAGVASIGYGNEAVLAAIETQLKTLPFVWSGGFASTPSSKLAQILLEGNPGGLCKALFVSSGAQAVETGLKLARQYYVDRAEPEREFFIARHGSFHGVTIGALGLSGHPFRRAPFESMLSKNVKHISTCFPFHHQDSNISDEEYIETLREELENTIENIGATRVAAICAETVVGATLGAVEALPGYYKMIRRVCDQYGILLLLDEVMCGLGRTGSRHAWMDEGIKPDIVAVGKTLAGGYMPLSAVLFNDVIVRSIAEGSGQFVHGHTYQSHPVACAAACAVQTIVSEKSYVPSVREKGDFLKSKLRERLKEKKWVGDIRGRGLFIGVEFLKDKAKKTPFDKSHNVSMKFRTLALENELSVMAINGTIDGHNGNHIFLAPQFNISENELIEIVDKIEKTGDQLFRSFL